MGAQRYCEAMTKKSSSHFTEDLFLVENEHDMQRETFLSSFPSINCITAKYLLEFYGSLHSFLQDLDHEAEFHRKHNQYFGQKMSQNLLKDAKINLLSRLRKRRLGFGKPASPVRDTDRSRTGVSRTKGKRHYQSTLMWDT